MSTSLSFTFNKETIDEVIAEIEKYRPLLEGAGSIMVNINKYSHDHFMHSPQLMVGASNSEIAKEQ